MNSRILLTMASLAGAGLAWSPPAHAVGCFSGGLAGAVAGHMVNHGVLGAVGGCIAGHQYNKHQKQQRANQSQYQQDVGPNYSRNGAVDSNGYRTQ